MFITITNNNSNLIILRSLWYMSLETPRVRFQQQSEKEKSSRIRILMVSPLAKPEVLREDTTPRLGKTNVS